MASYTTLAEFKTFMRLDAGTTDDALAQLAIDAATEAIDLALGLLTDDAPLAVTGAQATDLFTKVAHGLAASAGVQFVGTLAGGAGLAIGTQYYVLSPAADTFQLALTPGGAAVNFTTDLTAGNLASWAQLVPVPPTIKLATQLQAERYFKRRDAPFGVMGSAEFGTFARLLPKLDPDVELMISGHGERRRWGTTA